MLQTATKPNEWLEYTKKWQKKILRTRPLARTQPTQHSQPPHPDETDTNQNTSPHQTIPQNTDQNINTPSNTPGIIPNNVINKALKEYDRLTAITDATFAQRPTITLFALSHKNASHRQPYITTANPRAILAFRAGRLDGDPPTGSNPDNPDEPPYIRCPDCTHAINDENDATDDRTRQLNIMFHRLTDCHHMTQANNWYHDVAVRIAPTLRMARTIGGAKLGRGLMAEGRGEEWRQLCSSLVLHLLSPTDLCSKDDKAQQDMMLSATSTFLSRPQEFPDANQFGPSPSLRLEDGTLFLPATDNVFGLFTDCCVGPSATPNSVPSPSGEAEAEALRVSSLRRSARIRGSAPG